MPALGSSSGLPAQSGRVASLYATSVTAITGTSATEGTNRLTYTCEKTGAYRVTSYLRVNTAGTGASQSNVAQVAYNNGTTVAAANVLPFIGAGTLTAFDLTAAAGTAAMAQEVVFGVVDTNIVLTLSGSGAFTPAALIDIYFAIEAI